MENTIHMLPPSGVTIMVSFAVIMTIVLYVHVLIERYKLGAKKSKEANDGKYRKRT